MTRVSLPQLDPMPALRAAKKDAVNAGFNALATQFLHRDLAYAQKRRWAANAPALLELEANLRGMTVDMLAAAILSKPDLFAEREMKRQRLMLAIDQAKSPDDLNMLTVNIA